MPAGILPGMATKTRAKTKRPIEILGDAEYIAAARSVLGLSQPQFAETLGLASKSYIYRMEKGERPLSLAHRLAIECLLRRAGKWPVLVP